MEIYIHIPFCVKKCAYCDFLSGPSTEKMRADYVELLCSEILHAKGKYKDTRVSSIFFGGGTPSLLTKEQVTQIMDAILMAFEVEETAEITMEMNPGTMTEENLLGYKESGINRISMGLQSVHDDELKMLGRIHTYEQFVCNYQMARKAGYQNINVDLISAIPGQSLESWKKTLQTVLDLNPEHISAYSLIIEPGTPFYEWYEEGKKEGLLPLPSEEEEREIYWETRKLMEANGYHRYEISNYAKEGYECRHNIGYWKRVPYIGFGVGAASFLPNADGQMMRYTNPSEVTAYKEDYDGKFQGELLSKEEEMEEFIFLGLRMMEGIEKEEFQRQFSKTIESVYEDPIKKMVQLGLMEESESTLKLTEKGIDMSNAVFVEFLLD